MVDKSFCGECGTKLKRVDSKACSKCGSDATKTTKFCNNCGKEKASPNAFVCISCGSSIAKPSLKDPVMATLISVVCMLFFCAPSIGYIYLNNVRKGIIYLILSWIIGIIGLVGAYFCCFPIILPLIFNLLIVWDVYLEAKGEETKLPSFE